MAASNGSSVSAFAERVNQDRKEARAEAGITEEAAKNLQDVDRLCRDNAQFIESLCRAIEELSKRTETSSAETVGSLARQASYWAFDLRNSVNCHLEDLGCNELARRSGEPS